MKNLFFSKPILLTSLWIACMVFFNACSNKKIGSSDGKDWGSLQVVFRPGASQQEISAALGRIDTYIINHIYKEDPDHKKITTLNISHNITFGTPNTGTIILIRVDAVAMGGGKIKINPPRPPKDDLFPKLEGVEIVK